MLHSEVVGGIVLVVTAAVALAWANSPFAFAYHALWHQPLALRIASYAAEIPLHFLVNEGLMTVFFLVVGLEVRRELHDGALASARLAALPLAAALGGVVVPALLYLALNVSAPARAGWAIGSATDIAFAVGVLALLGRRAPPATRIFLLSIAVIDDIAAVLIIAFFYSDGLDYAGFLVVCAALALVLGMQRAGVSNTWAYMFPGVTLWAGLLWTGAHPTLAGVVLGLMTPVRAPSGANDRPPLARVQAALHPWVAFGVLPLFALVNAGVSLEGVELASDGAMIAGGVLIALVVGKPLGIVLGTWLAVVLGRCTLPPGLARRGVVLAGLFGGIGFTMSIFVATLAFPSAALLDAAKLGVLIASGIAGALGLAVGYASARRTVAREARNTAARERSRI